MYSGWSYPDPSRSYPSNDGSSRYQNEQSQQHGYSQVTAPPPRPMEPRPVLHTTLSDSMGSLRTQETFRYQDQAASDYRFGSQNLPGVKDILNSNPYSPSKKTYSATWNSPTAPSSGHHDGEGQYSFQGVHPPMVLHPPTPSSQRYYPQLEKSYDLPHPDQSRPSYAPPLSPFGAFQDRNRSSLEVHQERPRHSSTGLQISNGVPSPHPSVVPDEPSYRTQPSASYRQGRGAHPVAGTETHGDYLGTEDIAGEGKFHVYADGHRIPTQVDGEQVNPKWGLTKANKPRKRLALACLDCREKKIKCEPGVNSCIQCEKAMRPCRKAPEKYSQADTATNYFVGSPVRKTASSLDDAPASLRNVDSEGLSKRRSRAEPSPPSGPNKRHRSNSPRFDIGQDHDRRRQEGASPMDLRMRDAMDGSREEPLMWENDPFEVEPEATLHLVNVYFSRINNCTDCVFPRRHFLNFVKNPEKCQNERMVLYAMLAAASIFADARWAGFGKQCAQIAGDAVSSELGRFNVSAAQSKLLLAKYHFAKGAEGRAWDLIGSAIRTVTYMELNTEEGCLDDKVSRAQARFEFGFSPEQLAECKRRTFWACFMQDRFCGGMMCGIKPQDVFIRLPCAEEKYETSVASDAPYFTNDINQQETSSIYPTSPLASMAWLVLVAAIWGDVTDFTFRACHRPDSVYRDFYESFYAQIKQRTQDWLTRAPAHLQWSDANLDRSIQHGYAGTFISMHILFHLSQIKLNRYMRHSAVPESVSRNIRTANHHGHRILQIMTALHVARREISNPEEGLLSTFDFSTPFPGYAILSAIDIVSAGGLDSNLKTTLDEIDGALGCLRELTHYWTSANKQFRACEKRFYQLKNITITPVKAKSGCWLGKKWGIKASLEDDFESENDCIYGLGEEDADEAMSKYWDAFKEG